MRIAFFDLTGTIIHHKSQRPLPLMREVLATLTREDWRVVIISRWSKDASLRLLSQAQITTPLTVLSSEQKGDTLATYLAEHPSSECFLVDDKPANLAAVKTACGNRVRLIGFVGSGKYTTKNQTPRLADWCAQNKSELALSAIDLCEGLPVSVDSTKALLDRRIPLPPSELASLLPGSDHPMSALSGETANVDHRAVMAALLDCSWDSADYHAILYKAAWITCHECLWKFIVHIVLRRSGLAPHKVLDGAYKHHEYTIALKTFAAANPRHKLRDAFVTALSELYSGIEEIGASAANCRVAGRDIELDRIRHVESQINEIFTPR